MKTMVNIRLVSGLGYEPSTSKIKIIDASQSVQYLHITLCKVFKCSLSSVLLLQTSAIHNINMQQLHTSAFLRRPCDEGSQKAIYGTHCYSSTTHCEESKHCQPILTAWNYWHVTEGDYCIIEDDGHRICSQKQIYHTDVNRALQFPQKG
jgi:hypothetical protein